MEKQNSDEKTPENGIKIRSFKDAHDRVDEIIKAYGGYWPPLSMLASLMEEVGELSREINALEGFKPKKSTEPKRELEEELGDIFFSLLCLANYYEISLDKALEKDLQKYWRRDNQRYNSKQ